MFKRLAEVSAVVVFMAAFLVAGAAVYAWLGPEHNLPDSTRASPSAPLLTEEQVFLLLGYHINSGEGKACSELSLKSAKYDDGIWTVGLVARNCDGLRLYSVDDRTGEVSAVSRIRSTPAATSIAPIPTPVPTKTPTPTPAPTLTPDLTQMHQPTVAPQHTDTVKMIERYLMARVGNAPRVECLRTAELTIVKHSSSTRGTANWMVRAENDSSALNKLGCPRVHIYYYDEWTGDVRRTH